MTQEHLIIPDCKKVIKHNQGLIKRPKGSLEETPTDYYRTIWALIKNKIETYKTYKFTAPKTKTPWPS